MVPFRGTHVSASGFATLVGLVGRAAALPLCVSSSIAPSAYSTQFQGKQTICCTIPFAFGGVGYRVISAGPTDPARSKPRRQLGFNIGHDSLGQQQFGRSSSSVAAISDRARTSGAIARLVRPAEGRGGCTCLCQPRRRPAGRPPPHRTQDGMSHRTHTTALAISPSSGMNMEKGGGGMEVACSGIAALLYCT